MQNILKGAPGGPSSPDLPFRERVGQALTATKPTVSRAEKMQSSADPTPNFNTHKHKLGLRGQHSNQHQPPDSEDLRINRSIPNGRRNQPSGAGVLSSASGLGIQDSSFDNISQGGIPSHDGPEGLAPRDGGTHQEKPSYTPVRRNQ